MNDDRDTASVHERWARLRFQVIGHLLAAPPDKGMLQKELEALSQRSWKHPVTGAWVRFGVSTIERWLHKARKQHRDPVGVLRRKVRGDLGDQSSLSEAVRRALREQYAQHTGWSVQLHHLNLLAYAEKHPELGAMPSYSTVRRFFQAQGLRKRRRLSSRRTEGVERAEQRLNQREVRSWEAEHVNAVWHLDGHRSSLKVLTSQGYEAPILIGVLDDRSRLVCHAQWYLGDERAQIIAHALSQAIMKRGRPASAYHDNGAGLIAEEIQEGLTRLSIADARTLSASPYMNGKMEVLWVSVEGQLMAMLENVLDLTLDVLNEATQAWCEYQYNRTEHSETGATPLKRFLDGPSVPPHTPDSDTLRLAFMRTERRTQRQSDGTVVISARRFEVPNAYRHLKRLLVRYASWDLSHVYLVDEQTSQLLCRLFPLDKAANASGVRRPLEPVATRQSMPLQSVPGLPALLTKLLRQQAATGMPPGYLPINEGADAGDDDDLSDIPPWEDAPAGRGTSK